MEILFDIIKKAMFAMVICVGFAVFFKTPKRALWVVAFLGALGFITKGFLMATVLPHAEVLATFFGASVVGVLAMYFAHRVHTPPPVFMIPAIVEMVPGKSGYECIIGILNIVALEKNAHPSFEQVWDVIYSGLKTGFILLALASGIILPMLLLNRTSVKTNDLNRKTATRIYVRLRRLWTARFGHRPQTPPKC